MPSFIIVGYVWQLLGRGGGLFSLPPIREEPRKNSFWIGLNCIENSSWEDWNYILPNLYEDRRNGNNDTLSNVFVSCCHTPMKPLHGKLEIELMDMTCIMSAEVILTKLGTYYVFVLEFANIPICHIAIN